MPCPKSLITLANDEVTIMAVCRMLGVQAPEDSGGRSTKVRCPFGALYHSDHGVSAAMRVYPDSNTAWCFSCSVHYTPVSLAARAWDCDKQQAAVRLLARVGHRPGDAAQLWQQVAAYRPAPDGALLAEALKTYCRRVCPDFTTRQFDAAVAARLSHCLALVDLVVSDDDVTVWLNGCKKVMNRALTM